MQEPITVPGSNLVHNKSNSYLTFNKKFVQLEKYETIVYSNDNDLWPLLWCSKNVRTFSDSYAIFILIVTTPSKVETGDMSIGMTLLAKFSEYCHIKSTTN